MYFNVTHFMFAYIKKITIPDSKENAVVLGRVAAGEDFLRPSKSERLGRTGEQL